MPVLAGPTVSSTLVSGFHLNEIIGEQGFFSFFFTSKQSSTCPPGLSGPPFLFTPAGGNISADSWSRRSLFAILQSRFQKISSIYGSTFLYVGYTLVIYVVYIHV